MSQERLDHTCKIPAGTRDAIHVPFVVIEFMSQDYPKFYDDPFNPGDWIKFTDDECTVVEKSSKKDAHGMINPFIEALDMYEPVVVLMKPGTTGPVRHNFDVNLNNPKIETAMLKANQQYEQEQDPNCAPCWVIRNNELTRN